MKLKYYLRGMGIGIILTAIVMGFALGGRKAALSDAEIIQRAKLLGMVEGDAGPLLDTQNEQTEENKDDASSPDKALDKEGKEISEKDQQEVSAADNSVSEVAGEKKEAETENAEGQQSPDSPSSETSGKGGDSATINSAEVEESADGTASGSASKVDASSELATDSEDEIDENVQSTQEVKEEAKTAENNAEASATESTAKVSGKTITIPGGTGSDQVAQILYREGLIDDAATFNRYLIDRRLDRVIRSGVKVIPDGADYEQIAGIITTG